MTKLISRIEYLLERDPRTRDNDDLLCATIWFVEANMKRRPDLSAVEFLRDYSQGLLTPAESIRRCRQKIQETTPLLRGTSYGKRKERAKNYTDVFNQTTKQ
jgi:hypothetical protein